MKIWLGILTVIALALGIAAYKNHHDLMKVSELIDSARRTGISGQTEKCAAQAEKAFAGYGYNTSTSLADFRSHYNAKMNKCFMSIDNLVGKMRTKMVFDAYERRGFAEFSTMLSNDSTPVTMTCVVDEETSSEQHCKTEEEFSRLTAKYWSD